MEVTLNTEKSPFCTIGIYSFSFVDNKIDVDLDNLTGVEKQQLVYNVRKGVLLVENEKTLESISEQDVKKAPMPVDNLPKFQGLDQHKEDTKELQNLLKSSVTTIKKEAKELRTAQLRELLNIEKEGKARKSLVSFLSNELEKHQNDVSKQVGDTGAAGMYAEDPIAARSTQVGDIVESEQEELVLSQDVLNQLGE